MTASREMTLEEYIAALHPNHSAVTEMHLLFQVSAEQSARIAELEAERDALAARIAGGVRANLYVSKMSGVKSLLIGDNTALLPLDGQTVTVIGGKP